MNYLKHLNAIFEKFRKDSRPNSTHLSLYFALLHLWNLHRFPGMFFLHRQDVMDLAKIGSKTTYHQCIKDLHHWGYMHYAPSHNPLKGSRVRMFDFGTSSGQVTDKQQTSDEQAVVPLINNNKPLLNTNKQGNSPSFENLEKYFETQGSDLREAKKFFDYYQKAGWRTKAGTPVKNWKQLVRAWLHKNANVYAVSENRDNLYTTKNKNYGKPL
ncbi:MAG: hypothetical protein RI572_12755 [Salegentibacter sp.]|uniref:hypothetical protein n=1 Tax=Salegentibacter sp. TaxID=1903072 RepID=UPI0028706AF0|nr:hypothetical protein [Salegentibacter sp.]MDR9458268.1 hypothetical protein [Salegentibacter sp.]